MDSLPDFHMCDEAYGHDLSDVDCHNALEQLHRGFIPIPYSLDGRGEFGLPYQKHSGNCYITIESTATALPAPLTGSFWAVPNDFVNIATDLIEDCVENDLDSLGGFHTHNFRNMVDWAYSNPVTVAGHPVPREASFITVTVSGPTGRKFSPGLYDPWVPKIMASVSSKAAQRDQTDAARRTQHELSSTYWSVQAEGMTRGGTVPYWQSPASADEMTYECDSRLGSPATVDCAHMEWQQLHPSSADTLTVGPAKTTFLHEKSCSLAISASVSLVLSWEQIRAAVGTLMNTCVQDPYGKPRGGRAFFAGKAKKRRTTRAETGITGLNALPPHANITIFAQTDAGWKGAEAESGSCTWGKVVSGQDVSVCGGK